MYSFLTNSPKKNYSEIKKKNEEYDLIRKKLKNHYDLQNKKSLSCCVNSSILKLPKNQLNDSNNFDRNKMFQIGKKKGFNKVKSNNNFNEYYENASQNEERNNEKNGIIWEKKWNMSFKERIFNEEINKLPLVVQNKIFKNFSKVIFDKMKKSNSDRVPYNLNKKSKFDEKYLTSFPTKKVIQNKYKLKFYTILF